MRISSAVMADLEQLLARRAFVPRVEAYLSKFRKATWYSDLQASDGYAAAERKLTEIAEERRLTPFATSIEPIVRSIMAYAGTKEDAVIDITDCKQPWPDSTGDRFGERHKFIVMNPTPTNHRDTPPDGNHTWGVYGQLGLQAVIIEAGYTYSQGWSASITLALPIWSKGGGTPHDATNFLAAIYTDGSSSGNMYTLIQENQGGSAITDTDLVLKCLLGMTPCPASTGRWYMGGYIRDLGFPDAEEYVVAKLPQLCDYFLSLAAKSSAP